MLKKTAKNRKQVVYTKEKLPDIRYVASFHIQLISEGKREESIKHRVNQKY